MRNSSCRKKCKGAQLVFTFAAASILHSNPEPKKYLMDGISAPTKTPNCVPHDVGCPGKIFQLLFILVFLQFCRYSFKNCYDILMAVKSSFASAANDSW